MELIKDFLVGASVVLASLLLMVGVVWFLETYNWALAFILVFVAVISAFGIGNQIRRG